MQLPLPLPRQEQPTLEQEDAFRVVEEDIFLIAAERVCPLSRLAIHCVLPTQQVFEASNLPLIIVHAIMTRAPSMPRMETPQDLTRATTV
mmetsp:Transcript_2474/g.5775  ORF Transcript_2474/g.5775 Transcript_2474/m.5775 type:complete len:90 (-) Transcript_2474:804-1073(-)